VLAFCKRQLLAEDGIRGKSSAVLVVQHTSSDLRLNPQVHAVAHTTRLGKLAVTAAV
jgi:hypothetical protein